MENLRIIITLSIFLLCGNNAYSAIVNYQFGASGFSGGGVLAGDFDAEDLNSDGIVSSDDGEILSLNYTFSGDSFVIDLSLSEADFNTAFSFTYNYSTNPGLLGDDANEFLQLVQTDVNNNFLDTFLINCNATGDCSTEKLGIGQNGDGTTDTRSSGINFVSVSSVPIPGALLLFLSPIVFAGLVRHLTSGCTGLAKACSVSLGVKSL